MASNLFSHYLRLALTLQDAPLPARAVHFFQVLDDEDRSALTAGRAETLLADARAALANRLAAESIQFWMRPEFFRGPYSSVAAAITGQLVVPPDVTEPRLRAFLDVLRSADFPTRWALAEAMEEAWYRYLPRGDSIRDAFAVHGIALKA